MSFFLPPDRSLYLYDGGCAAFSEISLAKAFAAVVLTFFFFGVIAASRSTRGHFFFFIAFLQLRPVPVVLVGRFSPFLFKKESLLLSADLFGSPFSTLVFFSSYPSRISPSTCWRQISLSREVRLFPQDI